MTEVMFEEISRCLSNQGGLTIFLILLTILLQAKVFKSPLDWDTSGHLYFAYLRYHGQAFKSSYNPGIKYILPRFYALIMPYIRDRNYRFRVVNLFSSCLLVVLLVVGSGPITAQKVPLFVILVLMANSLWINYATSAVEFHSVPLALIILLLPEFIPFPFVIPAQSFLIILMVAGFKITDCVYFLPVSVGALSSHGVGALIPLALCGGVIAGFTAAVFFKYKSSSVTYAKSRSFFHPKNRFVLINPLFIGIVGTAVWVGFQHSPFFERSLIFSVVVVLAAQRMFIAYFFYPVLVFSFFALLRIDIQPPFLFQAAWWGILAVFLLHTLPHILIIGARHIDIRMRGWIFLIIGHSKYLDQRHEQASWLEQTVKPHERVYLWGGHVALLLLGKLMHVSNTFYSHNHLFLWSGIKNKAKYAENVIREKKPEYIIAAHPLGDNVFPAENFADCYQRVHTLYDMDVYKLIK